MRSFRTPESQKAYNEIRANLPSGEPCALCSIQPIQQFENWKILPNAYPYDRIAERHEMIVPVRHVTEGELSEVEREELLQLKRTVIKDRCDYIIEATTQSIPHHFHLHLVTAKE